MKTRFIVKKIFSLLAVFLAAGTLAFGAEGSAAAHVRSTHTLTILTDLSDPHDMSRLMFRSGSGYDGVEYQILRSFAATLSAQPRVVIIPRFDSLFEALRQGRGDVAAASITATAARAKLVDFSTPYFPVRETVIVRHGEGARSFHDLAGKRAITQRGTTWEKECRNVPAVKLLFTEDQAQMFAMVAAGTADFAVTDSPMAMTYLDKYPNLVIAWSLPEKEDYAFAFPKGSDLAPLLNAELNRMKKTGAFYALLGRFYGRRGLAILNAADAPAPGH